MPIFMLQKKECRTFGEATFLSLAEIPPKEISLKKFSEKRLESRFPGRRKKARRAREPDELFVFPSENRLRQCAREEGAGTLAERFDTPPRFKDDA